MIFALVPAFVERNMSSFPQHSRSAAPRSAHPRSRIQVARRVEDRRRTLVVITFGHVVVPWQLINISPPCRIALSRRVAVPCQIARKSDAASRRWPDGKGKGCEPTRGGRTHVRRSPRARGRYESRRNESRQVPLPAVPAPSSSPDTRLHSTRYHCALTHHPPRVTIHVVARANSQRDDEPPGGYSTARNDNRGALMRVRR